MAERQTATDDAQTTTDDTRLQALRQVDRDLLSEHFHEVRTSSKPRNELKHPRYTVVVREEDGEPYVSTVSSHRDGHYRPEGDNVVLTFCIRGHPFLSATEYNRRLSDKISRRKRDLNGRQ